MGFQRGGARRQKVPQIETEHLVDTLIGLVKKHGVQASFQFKNYFHLTRPMAIHGLSLKDQVAFVEGLSQVNEDLQFKFKDLKDGFTEVARTFPSLRENFDLEIRSNLVVKLANATMVILNHVRRLKDVKKFQEACKGLSDYQVQELEKLRSLVAGEATPADDKTDEEVLTQELLDMEMPGTPGMSEENEEDLLKRALDTSPVPARKKVLKEHLKDEKRQKKPNKGKVKGPNSKKEQKLMKKPSGKMDKTKKKQANKNPKSTYQRNSLMFMPYKKKGHMAIRLRGGPQLVVVSKLGSFKKNQAGAEKLMSMFAKGKTLEEVLLCKEHLSA